MQTTSNSPAQRTVSGRMLCLCATVILAALGSLPEAQAQGEQSADVVFRNGPIFTAAGASGRADAVAVRDGKIVAVGSTQEVDRLIGKKTKTIELRGRMLMPGLSETHSGVFAAVRRNQNDCVVGRHQTLDSVLRDLAACAAKKPKGELIQGGLWEHQLVPEMSTLEGLRKFDQASGGRPVVLFDTYSEAVWVNSRVLQMAGIDGSKKVEGGEVVLAGGKPTGLLMQKAAALVDAVIPAYTPEQNRVAAIESLRTVNAVGFTGVMEGQVSANMMNAYKELDGAGKVSAWMVAAIGWDPKYGVKGDEYGPAVVERREQFRSTHLFPDAIKLVLDGVPPFRTAVLVDPYLNNPPEDPYFRGEPLIPLPELVGILSAMDEKGVMVKFRAVGDGAVREALDAVEIVQAVRDGPLKALHHVAHAAWVHPKDVPRFAKLGVAVEVSPMFWFPSDYLPPSIAQMGEQRARTMFPIRDLKQSGAIIAAATAWPAGLLDAIEPWNGIESLLTRRNPFQQSEALGAEQSVDLRTALEFMTIGAARVIGLESRTGSIEVGKSADLILLDRDLFAIQPESISETKVEMTMFEGRVVYGSLKSQAKH